jgi:hypothetical protein
MGAFLDKPKTEKTNDTGIGRVFFNEFLAIFYIYVLGLSLCGCLNARLAN